MSALNELAEQLLQLAEQHEQSDRGTPGYRAGRVAGLQDAATLARAAADDENENEREDTTR